MKLSVLTVMVLLAGTPATVLAQDLETNYQSLKDAEAKGDAEAVKKLAAATSAMAHKVIAEPAPEAADEKEAWTQRVVYAKAADDFSEYALYSVAVKSTQPATVVDLLATLETVNPKSRYLNDGYANYLYALSQSGATAKIPAVAEKGLTNFPDNPDLLLFLADHYMSAKQTGKAQEYANRLVGAMGRAVKPEGVSAADWDRKKSASLGRGYWISGVISGEANQYAAANKSLRAALPYIKGNSAMLAPALFHLGVANYQLGLMTRNKAQVLEGAAFSDQCAAIQSAYAQQAWKNSAIMKRDAVTIR